MTESDLVVGWWAFWLVFGVVLFCGLIWVFYRLAVWSDVATWREFIDNHAGADNGPDEKAEGSAEVADR